MEAKKGRRILVFFCTLFIVFGCKNTPDNSSGTKVISDTESETEYDYTVTSGKEKREHDYSAFPGDFVITEVGPSCEENRFYFYPDNSLVIEDLFLEDGYELGNWKLLNDTVILHIQKRTGRRGLGDPMVPEGMEGMNNCGEWPYDDYVHYEYLIDETMTFALGDFSDNYLFIIDSAVFATDFDKEKIFFPLDGDYPFVSMRPVDSIELTKYSKKELRLMRNEIFARYNYIFKSEDLSWHFGDKSWYHPRRENVDGLLTILEKKNIELIKKMENKN